MRQVSRRFRARIGDFNRWVTEVDWSNDGGHTWQPAELTAGTVTASSTQQIRWQCTLTLLDAPVGRGGINPFTTRLRVRHGMDGELLLPMGVYKVSNAARSPTDDTVEVAGQSFEAYLIGARFTTSRTFYPQPARDLAETLIREVLPSAQVSWRGGDLNQVLPKILEPRDRWPLIDGDRDATSVARSMGARIYAGPSGEWIAADVPALTDPAVWTANRGDVLISASEELSDDEVYNILVANGQSTDSTTPFPPGIAQDTDPLSLTYVGKSPDDGGFGPRPRFYTSQLLKSQAQAQKAAQGMLAPYLGLKQKVSFSQVHDPSLEPGDVGLVETGYGLRRVLLDSVTYSLLGEPMQAETRTTATRLDGSIVEAPAEGGDSET